jgi:hypothetical protein
MGAIKRRHWNYSARNRRLDTLRNIDEETIPDRIEAATYLIAAAMTKGKIILKREIHINLISSTMVWQNSKKPAAKSMLPATLSN